MRDLVIYWYLGWVKRVKSCISDKAIRSKWTQGRGSQNRRKEVLWAFSKQSAVFMKWIYENTVEKGTMEILGRVMVSWVTVVTASEHLTPRLIQPLYSPVATTSLNLIHCPAQVCFNTDTIFKTSSLRDVSRKSQYLRLLDGQRDTTSFSILSVAQLSAFLYAFLLLFPLFPPLKI